jgi:serine protease Do
VLAAAAVVVGATGLMWQGRAAADARPPLASVAETSKAFTEVTKSVAPAVVHIRATKQMTMTSGGPQMPGGLEGQIPDEMLRRFFGDRMPEFRTPGPQAPQVGEGSGFLISSDGYILTNNHVVGGTSKLEVTLHDGNKLVAKVIGTDERTDVALIKVEGKGLPTLPLGNSETLEVGEWVLAIGSPFGLAGTVTSGIVSAKERDGMGITDYENFIQTDAAINPGNSGGPLVNLAGEAVGINTAILSRTGAYNGIGFAIPMNMAKQICDQLMEHGSVTRGFLGVIIQPLTPELARAFGMPETTGALVGDVADDGPAARSGLQRGDVIVKLDGEAVKDTTSFRNRVAMIKPQTSVALEVLRDGQTKSVSVEVGRLPDSPEVVNASQEISRPWGLQVQTLDSALADKLGVSETSGVVVTSVEPGSAAASAGMQPGMVVQEVNRQAVKNASEFETAVKATKDGDSLLLLVQLQGQTRYVVLQRAQ